MKNRWKTSYLLNLDYDAVSQLSKTYLSKAVSQIAAIANKRAKRLAQSEYGTSSALVSFEKSGGKAGSKGKSLNQLRREFARTQKFLNAKTSTIRGAKKVVEETSKRLGADTSKWSVEDWKAYWKAYDEIKANPDSKIALYRLGSDRLQQMIRDEVVAGKSYENIIANANDISYEIEQKEMQEQSDVDTDFFNMWEEF